MKQLSFIQAWGALIVVCLGIFIITLDGTMMNVAAATIAENFQTDFSNLQTTIILHSLVMASLYLTGGKLGDVHGKKQIFRIGIILFGIGTLIPSISPNLGIFIISWSGIKSFGGTMMIPAILALIIVNYSEAKRAFAFGVYAAVISVAILVGPILMGFLTDNLSWRLGFGLEAVIALLTLGLISSVKETDKLEGVKFDWVGTVLSALGIAALIMGASLSGQYGWWTAKRPFPLAGMELTPLELSVVPFMLGFGIIMIMLFVNWEDRRVDRGEMPLFQGKFFFSRQYTFGLITSAFVNISMAGFLFIMPIFLLNLGMSNFQAGLVLLPYTIALTILSLTTSSLSQKIAPKYIIQFGIVLMLFGVWITYDAIATDLTIGQLIPGLALFGAGTGIVNPQISNVPLSAVEPEDSGTASGVLQTANEMGIAFGIAIIGSVLMFGYYSHFTNGILKKENLSVPEEIRQQMIVKLEDRVKKVRTPQQEQEFVDQLPPKVQESLEQILPSVNVNAQKTALDSVFNFILMSLLSSAFLAGTKLRSKKTS